MKRLIIFTGTFFLLLLPNHTIAQCNLVITDPSPVCWPSKVDLTNPDIVAGSDADLSLTYWSDASATTALINPSAIPFSGTYYIMGTNPQDCSVISPVVVTIDPEITPIFDMIGPLDQNEDRLLQQQVK